MNTNLTNQGGSQNVAGNPAPRTAEQAVAELWSAVGENAKLQAQVAQATATRLLQVESGMRKGDSALATAVIELQQVARDLDRRLCNIESRLERISGTQPSVMPVIHSLAGTAMSR
jgi:hypothetical protein